MFFSRSLNKRFLASLYNKVKDYVNQFCDGDLMKGKWTHTMCLKSIWKLVYLNLNPTQMFLCVENDNLNYACQCVTGEVRD